MAIDVGRERTRSKGCIEVRFGTHITTRSGKAVVTVRKTRGSVVIYTEPCVHIPANVSLYIQALEAAAEEFRKLYDTGDWIFDDESEGTS